MADKEDINKNAQEEVEAKELSLDDLNEVNGGGLSDLYKRETVDITDRMKENA